MEIEQKASPELCKFFDRLTSLKKHIKSIYSETGSEEVREIYIKLDNFFKTKNSEGENE